MSIRTIAAGIVALAIVGLVVARSLQKQEGQLAAESSDSVQAAQMGHRGPNPVDMKDIDLRHLYDYRLGEGKVGSISYTLDEPALVNIKAKSANTRELFLSTIVDFGQREAGRHTESWDGRDHAGRVLEPTAFFVIWSAESMASFAPGSLPPEDEVAYADGKPVFKTKGWAGHAHAKHATYAEETPKLTITTPAEGDTLSGVVWIRSVVDEEKRGYGNKVGYGVRYYVGEELAQEEFYKPESDGKFAYRLDTTAFPDGELLLQVGMCDHNEHQTSLSVRVIFDNAKRL